MKHSIKRAQSRAGSSFAERENFRPKVKQLKKTILTLVALLAVTTGAWATAGVKLTTVELVPTDDWNNNNTYLSLSDMPGLTADGITEEQAKAWADVPKSGDVALIYGYKDCETYISYKKIEFSDGKVVLSNEVILIYWDVYDYKNTANITIYYATGVVAPSGPEVDWNKTTKTGTFTMPAGNVELQVEYYPGMLVKPTNLVGGTMEIEGLTDTTLPEGFEKDDDGNIYVAKDTKFTVKAVPAEGYHLVGWSDDAENKELEREFTMGDDDFILTATFSDEYDLAFEALNANTIEDGKATVKVGDTDKTADIQDGKLTGVKYGQNVTLTAAQGYKFRTVEAKKQEAELPKYTDVVTICEKNGDGKYLISSFFDGTNANITTITKEEAIALAEYLGGGNIRVVYEEYEFSGDRYVRATNAAGNVIGLSLSTTNTSTVPLYYVPAGN